MLTIFSAIHNFCVSNNSSLLGRFGTQGGTGTVTRGAQLLGADMYKRLDEYLQAHLNDLRVDTQQYNDEGLIQYYNKIWDRYTTGARYLNHIFDYINRHWIKREREEGRRDIHDVNTLCLVRWKSELFDPIQNRIVDAILKQIEKQRNGEAITSVNIKQALQSFVSLGLDENNTKKTSLAVYKQFFEQRFLDATRDYYTKESDYFLANHSVIEYIKKASQRIQEENGRIQMLLHPSTETTLMPICDEVLIANHAQIIQDEFYTLLSEDRRDDFHQLYKLLSRVEGLLAPIQTTFQDYVRKQGLAAVEKLAKEVEKPDPKAYVDTLLAVQSKYAEIVRTAFESNSELVKSLDTGCNVFINSNTIALPANAPKGSESKTPELLARYTDQLLKKSSKTAEETDVDAALNGIMTLFQYVDAKDSFEKFYKRLLSRRLVNNSSASEDAETNMVAKLKEVCGYDYTNKLQKMFQDMTTSSEMISEFKANLSKDEYPIDFNACILAENYWPLPQLKWSYTMPKELHPIHERFQGFYNNKHTGRRLKWLWNFSKGDLKANFVKGNKVGYTFTVSAYQLSILLPFNEQDTYTWEQLLEITQLPEEILSNSLAFILKAKLLLKEPSDAKTEDKDTKFTLNFDFKNKKVRINLNLPMKTEQKQEVDQTHKSIEEDRKFFLQAVIVRIMKARKELKHVSLVQETIEQSRKRFQPKVPEIKKSIDALVDKEYLERLEDNKYRYLA
ncbi:hypothetical protein TRICI_003755 [Trichomonascus ciferrii]|uniref:Cullin family profile domain-containing protein n=1 Tax=Trichomonascus ciferrii TaxID=44093 RepID=A0A642V819_9ASCO|nr:hypothetical protein TRICI_003755 [Trichomonascus ciferrii]